MNTGDLFSQRVSLTTEANDLQTFFKTCAAFDIHVSKLLNWDRNDPNMVFNRQYHYRALASLGVCMGGQEGHGVLGQTVKKVKESRADRSISQGGGILSRLSD